MKAHRLGSDLGPKHVPAVIDTGTGAGYVSAVAPPKRRRGVRIGYEAELGLLDDTYALVRNSEDGTLASLVDRIADQSAVFVGSGGAFALAQLAADLHQHYTGHVGRAMTPLECSTTTFHGDTAVVMFTASGRHPDAGLAARSAKRTLPSTIAVITLKAEGDLPADLRGDRVTVVTIPCSVKKDGFLATNSILAMSTALVKAYAKDVSLPARLRLDFTPFDLRPNTLVLFPARHAAVAFDIEARLHETGLAAVQFADYRNFGHGRHAGLARRITDTTVIAVVSPDQERLAKRTLAELPKTVQVERLATTLDWPVSVLDLLVGSMKMIVPAAQRQRVNPSRPGVATFGRRLYHLAAKEDAPDSPSLPIARKLYTMGRARADASIRATLEQSLDAWLASVAALPLGGLVLDYDGTCCTTEGRYSLPVPEVQAEIKRVIKLGLHVGFASGRGASLQRDLRKWIPRECWRQVVLGLYNGAVLLGLDEDLADQSACGSVLGEARDRLTECSFSHLITLEAHTHQVEVRLRSPHSWSGGDLATAVHEILQRSPSLSVKVVASAHAVDVVDSTTTKRVVVDALRQRCDGAILAIGDQGQIGGNDFELLAAMTTSLSVDRCSSDPTRCWNLDCDGHRGPTLLERYLGAVRSHRRSVRFTWRQA